MAETVAAVKLTLKDRGFSSVWAQTESRVQRGAKAMGRSLRSELSSAAKGGIDALKGLGSRVKGIATMAGGIVGAVGFGALVKGAIDADTRFRKLAFTMKAGQGAFNDYGEIQRHAERLSKKWAQSSEDLSGAMETVFNTVGDAEFARDTLEEIAKAATASGQEISTIAPIVAEMRRQFGLNADEIPDNLAALMDLGRRGGMSIEEMGANLGKLGKLAGTAGLEGAEGMRKLVALTNELTAPAGSAEAAMEKLQQIIISLKASPEKLKQLQLLKIDPKGKDAIQLLDEVMKATKGSPDALGKIFGESGAFVAEAFGGIEDLSKAMDKASKSALSASDVQGRAEENVKSAGGGIKVALETLEQAFRKPQMMSAIEKLAEKLPALADGIATLTDIIVDNPALTGAAMMGGTFMRGAGASLLSGGGGGGAAIGQAAAGAMMQSAGGIGGAIATAFAAAPAILMAGAALAAAYEQAVKLAAEIAEEDKREAGHKEDIMRNAEALGQKTVEWEEGGWLGGDKKYLARDLRGRVQTYDTQEEAEQNAGPVRVGMGPDDASYEERLRMEDASRSVPDRWAAVRGSGEYSAASLPALGMGVSGPAKPETQPSTPAPQPVKIDPASSADQARAMADQIRSSELRVRVVNPDQIGAAVSKSSPGTTPGGLPRPGSAT